MIKGLIFDLDGTMVMNMPFHMRAFNVQAERHGYTLLSPLTSRFFGWHNFQIMPEIIPAADIERIGLQYLSDEKEAIYRELYSGNVTLTKGLDKILDEAVRCGVKTFIGSAAPRENVEFIVAEAALDGRMVGYVCADDVTHCKPDPEIFLKSCEKLGLAPSECVVFEDATSGIKAAVAAGCYPIGIATTTTREALLEAGARMIIDDFDEISVEQLVAQIG